MRIYAILLLLIISCASALWLDADYGQRTACTITTGGEGVYYNQTWTCLIDTTDTDYFQTDCDDILVGNNEGTESYNHTVANNTCGTTNTQISFRVPETPAGGNFTVQIYHNDSDATNHEEAEDAWARYYAVYNLGEEMAHDATGNYNAINYSYGITVGPSTYGKQIYWEAGHALVLGDLPDPANITTILRFGNCTLGTESPGYVFGRNKNADRYGAFSFLHYTVNGGLVATVRKGDNSGQTLTLFDAMANIDENDTLAWTILNVGAGDTDNNHTTFINGVVKTSQLGYNATNDADNNMTIGRGGDYGAGYYWGGCIDELYFSNQTFSRDEVLAISTAVSAEGATVDNVDLTAAVSAPNVDETGAATITLDIEAGTFIWEYNYTIYYNNTLVANESIDPMIEDTEFHPTVGVYAPFVDANSSIAFNASVSALVGDTEMGASLYTATGDGEHNVSLYYDSLIYEQTPWNSSVEDGLDIYGNTTWKEKPTGAVIDVRYLSYYNATCALMYANASQVNVSCNDLVYSCLDTIVPPTNPIACGVWEGYHDTENYTILANHTQIDGVIYMDVFVNQTWYMFNNSLVTTEVLRVVNSTLTNSSREYFVWIVNSTNGSIDGADNITTWLNATFYDATSLDAIDIDSVISAYTVTLSDGTTKNFTIPYSGVVSDSVIRGYPDWFTANLSAIESYGKSGYATSNRFMVYAPTPLGTQQDVSIYLLNNSEGEYAIINVVNQGAAVAGAYVTILKYYAAESSYIQVDQRVTNSNGQAATYIEPSAYYKFIVYDGEGGELYASTLPEQFICDTTCSITINIADLVPLTLISPYAHAECHGNASTNSVTFTYADETGTTSEIAFRIYKENSMTPVLNYNTTGAAASYVYTLTGGENLSENLYSCEVWRTASPWTLEYVTLLDFRTYVGIVDWGVVALAFLSVLGAAAFHVSLAVGIGSIGLFVLSLLGIIQVPVGVTVPIMVVGLAIAFLLSKRGND